MSEQRKYGGITAQPAPEGLHAYNGGRFAHEVVDEEVRKLRKSSRVEERLAAHGAPARIIRHVLAAMEKRTNRSQLPPEMRVRKGETAEKYVERMKRDYPTLAKDLKVRPDNERRAGETETAFHKRRAQKIREEVFRSATKFRVVHRGTNTLCNFEDADADFIPVFEEAQPRDVDAENRARAEKIGKTIAAENAAEKKREDEARRADRPLRIAMATAAGRFSDPVFKEKD
jgi:hypothetical protein